MASRNSHGGITAGPINAIERDLDVLTDALQTLSTFFLLAGAFPLIASSAQQNAQGLLSGIR
jgi:hypothetical protein